MDLSLTDQIEKASSIKIITNQTSEVFQKGNEKFESIMSDFLEGTKCSHEMPAFGVSINDLTLKDMQSGEWIEFAFDKENIYMGMPYEKILIKLSKGDCGANLIRFTKENGYTGRCFYLDNISLDKLLDNFE
ncbi:MAG: hypothetical protein RR400_01895 [Clostridia bacterium]